ncbi:MAG TPA: BTAD domain-containing putative transcriptional regulator [Sphingomonas sp.]|uniref:BTAD domain-containing putative transcriptional regulator n=1 Tax=Sphingomonas sp. TaxID=28214 RepID=UPI002BFBD630|nr:BTAD domain-containing putative transcriptional regulator [Sphingomonas sp.]HMI19715.1 BTAD domain-containing putative transcriptional regulator [Sphingomonas sp.]
MAVRISLLGEFQLSIEGVDARPRGRKARGLLAYLAVAQDQSVSRDRAADLLWSDRGTEQARGSLRQTLAEIRGSHDALRDLLRVSRDTIAFAPHHAEVDVDLVMDACSQSDASRLASCLDGADTFVADLSGLSPAFEDWLQIERTRQSERIVAAATHAVPRMIGVAQPMDVQAILRSLDGLDPLNEAVARLGFSADHAAGDVAALHRRYRKLVDGLQREFGVRPSPETQALFDSLTAGPQQPAVRAAEVAETEPPMILVSPIEAIGGDASTADIAAIVTDDIRTALRQHADVRVLTLAAGDLDRVERVCRDSVAAYMLSGRIRRIGDDVRVNLQIGNVASSSVVWSEQIKVDTADLGEAVERVVQRAAGAVLPAIDHDLATRMRLSDFASKDIATSYVKARRLVGRGHDLAETQQGVDLLEEIVEGDTKHVGARMLLARMYNNDLWQRVVGHDVAAYRARALALTQQAAALAPADGRIQLRLAWCQLRQHDWAAAERGLRAAATRLTYDADGLNECASGFSLLGELIFAEQLIQQAFRLNPFAPGDYHADRAMLMMLRGDHEIAEEHFSVSGEQGPLYLYARLANLSQLPDRADLAARLGRDFRSSFARAWQPSRAATPADVLEWIEHSYPLRLPGHAALFRAPLAAGSGADWPAAWHNAP